MHRPEADKILVINSGSSSFKSSLFRFSAGSVHAEAIWKKEIEWKDSGSQTEAAEQLLESLSIGNTAVLSEPGEIAVIGHRVVHGGDKFSSSTLITDPVIEDLKSLVELAPLHEPLNLKAIQMAARIFPSIPQIAVFDTAFHRTLPEHARVYAGPYSWYRDQRIQRFGFHGISHQYCYSRATELLSGPHAAMITCHIGNGVSLSAIESGVCINTTMGYTPLDGLVMGTRSGSIDPGIILHLLQHHQYTVDQLGHVLNFESGLQGLCANSDMRKVERALQDGDPLAALAFDIYTRRLSSAAAALVSDLGRLDALVFAGGVGENSFRVRTAVCERLKFLGVQIDETKNQTGAGDRQISRDESLVAVLVVNTREDLQIAADCIKFHFLSQH